MSDVAVGRHALLSDCGAAALVTDAGSVDWLCLPRFDDAPVMARLLDNQAGHFLIAPAHGQPATTRRYRPFGLVLDTTWDGPDGTLVLSEAMAMGRHDHGHQLGRAAPGVLLRHLRCTRGTVAIQIQYAPRPEAGLVHPRLRRTDRAVVTRGGATVLVLSTDVELQVDGATADAVLTLTEGQDIGFALAQAGAWDPEPPPWTPRQIRRGLDATEAAWTSWAQLHQRYEGPHRALVHHSGVVLQALTFARTGAMVAAPTTSLPEGIGSARTWDYRFTWVRDASMTMQGLWIAACPEEAGRFFSFLATAASTQLDRGLPLGIMFGIGGERDLTERELPHLSGWRDSRPVRVGNDAWQQEQLDVYGALLDAAFTVRAQLVDMHDATRAFLVAAADAAAARWAEDDQGIWEMRGPGRPYLHSKLMCWVALDRALAMSELLSPSSEQSTMWATVRADIRATILEKGWNEHVGAYTQTLGSDQLDASTLLLAILGFLPPDDARLVATIDAVERELSDERGLLYRYRGEDGLAGTEGTFLLCTFWLAHALAVTGRLDRAAIVLDRAAGYATDLGLFAEQIDTTTGELLGNFPQAFSHLGLITAAHALTAAHDTADKASRRQEEQRPDTTSADHPDRIQS